ncbi:MAG TPA: hypothetical protein DEB40_05360 [Elusimicrobia bacterium]|nr:hypothetical protein [Elusimicrobiota bacterium]HBT61153.1 hypothetical protein [Elusimicrobiota bacterium]
MTTLRAVVLIGAAGLWAGCAGLPPGSSREILVAAEGWAPIDARDSSGTRRRALADAQRKAVEQVSGTAVASLIHVRDAMTVRQKVITEVRGFVSRTDVLDERKEGGFFKIRIRAFIRPEEPSRPAGPLPAEARFALTVTGLGLRDEDLGAAAAAAIRKELLARGFDLSDDSTGPDSWLLQGDAAAVPILDSRLGSFHSARAQVSLRVLEPKTQTVVWETSQESSALGLDPRSAALAAAQAAGALAGQHATGEVLDVLWKRF